MVKIQKVLNEKIKAQNERIVLLQPLLKRCIRSLQDDATNFCNYALKLALSKSMQAIAASLDSTSAQATGDDKKETSEIPDIIKKFEKLSLSPELSFKPDTWFRKLRYGVIFSTVEEMQDYATGLQEVQTALEKLIDTICLGTTVDNGSLQAQVAAYEKLIPALQKDLENAKEKLKAGKFSTKIHAGLHYGAELLAYSEEIAHLSRVCSRLIQPKYLKIFKAFLDLRTVFNFSTPTNPLFVLIKELDDIPKVEESSSFEKIIARTTLEGVKEAIRRRAHSLLGLTPEEEKLKEKILLKNPLNDIDPKPTPLSTLPAPIEELVKKQCLLHRFCNKKRGDSAFSMLLSIIQTHYDAAHTKSLALTPGYKDMVSAYLSCNPLVPYAEHFDSLNRIYVLLKQPLKQSVLGVNMHLDLYRYTQARYLLLSIKPALAEELTPLYEQVDNELASFSNLYELPLLEADQKLYAHLLNAVWEKNEEAAAEVEKIIGDQILINPEPVLQTLLDAFLLIKIKQEKPLTEPDEKRLDTLLGRYATSPHSQAALSEMHNYLFMEKLLLNRMNVSTSGLKEMVYTVRSETLHHIWEKVISDFENWIKDTTNQPDPHVAVATKEVPPVETWIEEPPNPADPYGVVTTNQVPPYENWKAAPTRRIDLYTEVTTQNVPPSGHEQFFKWIASQLMSRKPVQGSLL